MYFLPIFLINDGKMAASLHGLTAKACTHTHTHAKDNPASLGLNVRIIFASILIRVGES